MDPKPSKEVLRVAQELSFARALAGNDRSLRDRALKRLNKWFATMPPKKESFTTESFTRLWKGLYYCVWMSDKPLPQEDCVERISKLIHSIKNFEDARKFVRCFFQCMSQNWQNLDGFRYDKYLMLVRRFLRQLLERLRQSGWDMEMLKTVIDDDLLPILTGAPLGLNIHISEVFFEELAKVGRGEVAPSVTFEFVRLFGELLAKSNDMRFTKSVTENVFFYLLRQTDEAIEHQMKFQAWRSAGFPGGDIDLMEKVSDDEEENEDEDIMGDSGSDDEQDGETPLDPRAGRVDVELPPVDFDPKEIMNYLTKLKTIPEMLAKVRRQIGVILNKYQTYKSGKYPLGLHKVEVIEPEDEDKIIEEAAEELAEIEQKLIAESDVGGLKKHKLLTVGQMANGMTKIRPKKRKQTTWETSPIVDNKCKAASPATKGSWTISPTVEANGTSRESSVAAKGFVETPLAQPSGEANKSDSINSTPKLKNRQSSSSSETESPKAKKVKKKKKREGKQGITDSPWGDSTDDWEHTNDEIEISLSPVRNDVTMSQLVTPVLNGHSPSVKTASAKKVEFVLHKNTAQEEEEYHLSVKKRPSRPFEAALKPYQGVLKTPTNSPVVNSLDKIPPSLAEIS